MPERLLVPSILQFAGKRHYQPVGHTRTSNIWRWRGEYMAYEKALILEAVLDTLLNPGTSETSEEEVMCQLCKSIPDLEMEQLAPSDGSRKAAREVSAKRIVTIVEHIFPQWQTLASAKFEDRSPGMERFEEGMMSDIYDMLVSSSHDVGYILTRIIQKGAEEYKYLHKYPKALELYTALLSQRRWRSGRRGLWHDQKSLVLMQMAKSAKMPEDMFELARKAIEEALKDPDTHLGMKLCSALRRFVF